MDKYSLINYFDVWGNEQEGWEVNNLCKEEGEIILHDYTNESEILSQLKEVGFLKESITVDQLEFWNDYDMIEFYVKDTMQPIGRLERIQ